MPVAVCCFLFGSLGAPALVLEEKGGLGALRRGLELVLAFPGRVLGIFSLVVLLAGVVLGYPLAILLPHLAGLDGILAFSRVLVEYWPWFAVTGVLVLWLAPFALAVLVCTYYHLRAQEEFTWRR